MVPLLCFPSVAGADLTPELMNWTCLVYGGPMLFVSLWWVVSARTWFKGPKVNVEHLMLGREGGVVEGEDGEGEGEGEGVGRGSLSCEKGGKDG